MREASRDDRVPGYDVAGGHGVEEAPRGGEVASPAAPEHGEERVPGDDVALRHRVEHPACSGNIAGAGKLADALVVTDEAAGGESGGASLEWLHRDSICIPRAALRVRNDLCAQNTRAHILVTGETTFCIKSPIKLCHYNLDL